MSLITSRRGAEGLLNHVTLEHQIKSFDLEDKNIPLTFKMEKKKPTLALLVLQLIRPLAGSNLSLLRQKEKEKKKITVCRLIVNSVHV